MKGKLRKEVEAELGTLEALGGKGSAAMLCSMPNKLILARGAGAPTTQGRADGMARAGIGLADDPIAEALFAAAAEDGDVMIARKLTEDEGCVGLICAPKFEEAVVTRAVSTPDARQVLKGAGRLFALLDGNEEKAA